MAWCPKCKTEYEDHVKECADCHIELVGEEDLATAIQYKLLAYIPEAELDDIKAYLEYSKIDTVQVEESKKGFALNVSEEQYADAYKYLRVYIRERVEDEDEDEYELPEYDTIDVTSEGRMTKELASSAFSFFLIGGIMVIMAVLHFTDAMSLIKGDLYNYVIGALGIIFLGVGIFNIRKIPSAKAAEEKNRGKIDEFIAWFEEKYTRESYIKKKRIKVDKFDEGSLYFAIIDLLKKDLEKAFPEDDVVLINSACERIFESHFE